jgi:hypothetical protein
LRRDGEGKETVLESLEKGRRDEVVGNSWVGHKDYFLCLVLATPLFSYSPQTVLQFDFSVPSFVCYV